MNMTLGAFRKLLNRYAKNLNLYVYGDKFLGMPHNYSGNPKELAFTPSTTMSSVEDAIIMVDMIINRQLLNEPVKVNTPLWISEIDNPNGQAIVDVIPQFNHIHIITK